jgi:hypothetical protein
LSGVAKARSTRRVNRRGASKAYHSGRERVRADRMLGSLVACHRAGASMCPLRPAVYREALHPEILF